MIVGKITLNNSKTPQILSLDLQKHFPKKKKGEHMTKDKLLIAKVKKEMGYTDGTDCCKTCRSLGTKITVEDYECNINSFPIPVKLVGKCSNFKPED